MSSSLLLNERPLVVLPGLAEALGSLDEAVILQQLHYWLQRSSNKRDGRTWVYNSMSDWLKQFPWVKSRTTLTRHFDKLKKLGLVLTANYNRAGFDKTIWYSIDYDKLKEFTAEFEAKKSKEYVSGQSIVQNLDNDCTDSGQLNVQNLDNGVYKNCTTNTRDYTETNQETTTENNKDNSQAGQSPAAPSPVNEKIPYKEIIDYLNEKTGSRYKNVAGNQKMIKARWNEGYRLDDFKAVIDHKTEDWLGTIAKDGREMGQFLRPSTLFGSKFDQYLNEKPSANKTDAWSDQLVNLKDEWKPTSSDELPF